MSVILLAWAVMFVIFARNAPQAAGPKGLSEMLGVLAREPLAWALAALYFLTFGGFVAFSIYLPTLLRDQFGLKPADAGFRTAGFVVLATLCRPLGGWLSDRIGGSRVLSWILPSIASVDRSPIPWSEIPKAEVLFVIGANIGDCAPITTDYIWRCRDKGGKLIVADPRMTPITRNADLYLHLRPGTDLALLMGMLHVILRDGLVDREFIDQYTTGFEAVAESAKPWDLRKVSEMTGVPPESIEKAARWIGKSKRAIMMHARGLEHQSKGVENCLAVLNIALATGNVGREGAGPTMITGQGNGQGGREHGQKCDQLPGQRSLADPAAREYVAGVWGIRPDELPQPGYSAQEIMNAIHAGEIKGLLSMCFNPLVSLPDANFTREALSKLEYFGVID